MISALPVKNITLVIATLGAGGAERVLSLLAGEWLGRGYGVTVITLGGAADDHHLLPSGIERVALNALAPARNWFDTLRINYRCALKLRKALRRSAPDVVISFMDKTNVLALLAVARQGAPVVVSERIDPRYYRLAPGWQWLRRRLYPRAAALVVQTESVAVWAREILPAEKVHVIANPVKVLDHTGDAPGWLPDGPFICAMGRLDYQKGFDLLLQAYADLPAETPPLVIVGEGPERAALEKLVDNLSLNGRILLPGRVANPAVVLSRAKLFVMSSRFEGFPNALLEAMASGLPVISFDCPSGPADIIRDGENGVLVRAGDKDALRDAMKRLLGELGAGRTMGEAARAVVEEFSLERIMGEWDAVIGGLD